MRGIIVLLFVTLAIVGCLMQPYSASPDRPNVTVAQPLPAANATPPAPPPENCTGPVCASDGTTYSTDCGARRANATIAYAGACVPCDDSDGGAEPSVRGRVSRGNETMRDSCANETAVTEYSCVAGSIASAAMPCALDETCESGRCAPKPPANETAGNETQNPEPAGCSGPSEPDIYAKETTVLNGRAYNDTCTDYRVVKDYYCHNGNVTSLSNECPPGYACSWGVCIKLEAVCSDDDGGNDTTQRSTVLVLKGINTIFKETDDCVDEGVVVEYYCNPDDSASSAEIPCPSGKKCASGKCIRSACDDSDGGIELYDQGTTSSEGVEKEDDCVDDNTVREYYCYGDEVRNDDYACKRGYVCSGGRCVRD